MRTHDANGRRAGARGKLLACMVCVCVCIAGVEGIKDQEVTSI
jgi:hypothetical protein